MITTKTILIKNNGDIYDDDVGDDIFFLFAYSVVQKNCWSFIEVREWISTGEIVTLVRQKMNTKRWFKGVSVFII